MKGGVRQGTPGKTYSNRTDLHQPVQAYTGQEYGQAQMQQQWQRAMPLPQTQPAGAGAPPPSPPGVLAPAAAPPPEGPLPGSLTPLSAPTSRPQEPVTHGAASGPGAGPEVLGGSPVQGRMSQMLAMLAQSSGNNDLAVLAQRAQSLGQ